MGAIKDNARSTFADGPIGYPLNPSKAEIRQLFDLVDDEIVDAQTAVEGAAAGLVLRPNWAALVATPGTRTGQPGRVPSTDNGTHTDPVIGGTVANSGDYAWSTSPVGWRRVSDVIDANAIDAKKADRTLVGKRSNARLVLNRPIIVDIANVHGGGSAIYIPISGSYGNATDGTIFTLALTPDSKLTEYSKVTIPESGNIVTLYYDSVDLSVKSAVSPTLAPIDPDRYFHLVSVSGYSGTNRGSGGIISDYRVVNTRAFGASIAGCDRAVAYDRSNFVLFIPTLRLYDANGGALTLSPPTGSYYREITLPSSGSSYFVYIDMADLRANGPTSATAVKVVQGYGGFPSINREGAADILLLGQGFTQGFTPAAGVRFANVVSNEFGSGKEDNDFAERIFSNTAAVNLVNSASTALGFTRGFQGSAGSVYYGGYFEQPSRSGAIFARFFLETDTAGNFGDPRAYLFRRNADGTTSYVLAVLTLIKDGPTFREYHVSQRLPSADVFFGMWVGTDAPANNVRVFGLQFALNPNADLFISPLDYPRKRDSVSSRLQALEAGSSGIGGKPFLPIIPTWMSFVEGRPYPIFLDEIFGYASHGRFAATFSSRGAVAKPPYVIEGNVGTLELDATRLSASTLISFRDRSDSAEAPSQVVYQVQTKTVGLTAVAALNKRVLMIGDSLTEYNGTSVQAIARLQAMGATITSIGTSTMTSEIPGDTSTFPGEGRAVAKYADYINKNTDRMTPVAVGGEAAYQALSVTDKRFKNPFAKVPTTDDQTNRADMIYNRYIFDLRFFLNRFTLPDPDVVVINLGRNDLSAYTDANADNAVGDVLAGASVMIRQTRAALPSAKILVVWNSLGRYTQARWENRERPALQALISFIRNLGDSNVHLVPIYCTVSRDAGFQYTLTLDHATGMNTAVVSDGRHYNEYGASLAGEVLAQHIAGAFV